MEYFTIINFVLIVLGLAIGFVISKFLEKTSITKSFQNAKKEAENNTALEALKHYNVDIYNLNF